MSTPIAIGALETPIGVLWMASSERGLCKLVLPRAGARQSLERWLAAHLRPDRCLPSSPILEQALAEVRDYFAGTRQAFTVPLDLRGNPFQRRVWQALTAIPYGQTVSYGGLARALGEPKAARAVGAACGANPVPIIAA
jgi:O6-methylguanine-DNA--protein-cysteine methyltransferase